MILRLDKWFLPFVAGAVALFGVGLFGWGDYRVTVVNWNVAWGVFDLGLAAVIFATWLSARRRHWSALAFVGALTAMQLVDVLFSLVVYYDVAERPGILGWAFVGQPLFAWFTWRYVLRQVRVPAASGPDVTPPEPNATSGVRAVTE